MAGTHRIYVKVRGKWVYLYRAVDRDGKTVDFRLSRRREYLNNLIEQDQRGIKLASVRCAASVVRDRSSHARRH